MKGFRSPLPVVVQDGMMRGGWYPVGLVTAPSSQLVNKAIFTNEDALLQARSRAPERQYVATLRDLKGVMLFSRVARLALTRGLRLQGAWNVHSVQIKRQFITKEGAKLNNWKDMKECSLEYGYQMKEFPDEEVGALLVFMAARCCGSVCFPLVECCMCAWVLAKYARVRTRTRTFSKK